MNTNKNHTNIVYQERTHARKTVILLKINNITGTIKPLNKDTLVTIPNASRNNINGIIAQSIRNKNLSERLFERASFETSAENKKIAMQPPKTPKLPTKDTKKLVAPKGEVKLYPISETCVINWLLYPLKSGKIKTKELMKLYGTLNKLKFASCDKKLNKEKLVNTGSASAIYNNLSNENESALTTPTKIKISEHTHPHPHTLIVIFLP
ncbi:hypothetical protein IHE26_00555 [Plesiomonas shigelloides]|uniref:hypothetical protein n=1 Tax=Plesiomonas shigelloides TaxID=703 RepID=UPI0017874C45|nr:hypothetical protein [Plesiomonas shigelloides]QOH79865.1 hypothetical protein IHE26_00555 [Plesiomonas shigelloides]